MICPLETKRRAGKARIPMSAPIISLFLVVLCGWGFAADTMPPKALPAAGNGKTNIAVLNVKPGEGVSAGESELISDRLRGELFNTGKVNVMEREQMQEVLKEQGFQQSGACSDEACLVEMGQMLGVQKLVTGSIGKIGSMFMINMRVIDVQTAQITRVVSKDVKGNIEDVVANLPDIASQLVGAQNSQGNAGTQVESQPVSQSAPEQNAAVETRKEPEKQIEDPSGKAARDKNRAGVRISIGLFPGRLVETWETDTTGGGKSTITWSDTDFSKVTHSPLVSYEVKFGIKAGPYVTIDLGFGYCTLSNEYFQTHTDLTDWEYADTFRVYSFPIGVNFVKRWYPLKVNVGVLTDFNMLVYSMGTSGLTTLTHSDTTELAFNAAFGIRAGGEYLITPHIGFNLDFQYMYSVFEPDPSTVSSYDASGNYLETERKITWKMPAFGIDGGVNFYY